MRSEPRGGHERRMEREEGGRRLRWQQRLSDYGTVCSVLSTPTLHARYNEKRHTPFGSMPLPLVYWSPEQCCYLIPSWSPRYRTASSKTVCGGGV